MLPLPGVMAPDMRVPLPCLDTQAAMVVHLLQSRRFDLSNEKATQEEIAAALDGQGIAFSREHVLSPRDRPDFLLEGGLVIEAKLRSTGKVAIYRQLQRYAAHEAVRGLVLASNTAMGLPADVGGKPAWFASLGRGWL